MRRLAAYDEIRLDAISRDISEAVEQACFGAAPWINACQIFSDAFPGGFAALINQDFLHDRINFSEMVNIDPDFEETYCAHFAYINPWSETWTRMASGSVFVAEKHRPARTFADTEFYNDWLVPQGDVIGGVGLKVDASPTDVVYFPMHYPGRFADAYDRPAAEVSRRLLGTIERAIAFTGALRSSAERVAAGAALVDRAGDPAIVVDAAMRLGDANQKAVALFSRGDFLCCVSGKVFFADPGLSKRISAAVNALAHSPAAVVSRIVWAGEEERWCFVFARLPHLAGQSMLLPYRPQIMILMRCLTARVVSGVELDLRGLAAHFGLTPAEVRLCRLLVDGGSLADAAARLGISYGTARQRIKIIFQKTQTSRQSELCLLLARYAF